MTVSLCGKMQNNKSKNYPRSMANSSKKPRPWHQGGGINAMTSDTSMSCVPANNFPPDYVNDEPSAEAITTQRSKEEISIDYDHIYPAKESKEACVAREARLSESSQVAELASPQPSSIAVDSCRDRLSLAERKVSSDTILPNPPPPSLLSPRSSTQSFDQNQRRHVTPAFLACMCVPINSPCLHMSENVPVPSKTDVIARVSREELGRVAVPQKVDDESESFASGEEMEKKSEYSTADDGESEPQSKKRFIPKVQGQVNEDEGGENSPEDCTSRAHEESSKTDATPKVWPGILRGDSAALTPVLVRMVSQDVEVKVTSDDESDKCSSVRSEVPSSRWQPETIDDNANEHTTPSQFTGRSKKQQMQVTSESSVSMHEKNMRDGTTEPIIWSVEESQSAVVQQETYENASTDSRGSKALQLAHDNTMKERPLTCRNSAWKSLPSLPIVESFDSNKELCFPARDYPRVTTPYPTSRSVGQCLSPVQTTAKTQAMSFRVRRAMEDAMTLCEEELGPLAQALAQLREKVRKLNLRDICSQCRPSLAHEESRYVQAAPSLTLGSTTRTPQLVPSVTSAGALCAPVQQQIGWAHHSIAEPPSHDADCVCTYCGLQVSKSDECLSPVARMYILLAQANRRTPQCDENASSRPSVRGSASPDQRI